MQSERVHCRILGSCHRAKLGSKRMVGAAFLSIFVLNVVVYLVSQSEFLHSWFDCAVLAERQRTLQALGALPRERLLLRRRVQTFAPLASTERQQGKLPSSSLVHPHALLVLPCSVAVANT